MLESLFSFLLNYNPALAVIIYGFLVLLLINIFYKVLINQNDAKQLKLKMNEINKQMKDEQKAGNKEKANQLVNEMMGANSKLMKMTMKPMLVSFVIVIVMLPFLNAAYGDKIVTLANNTGTADLEGINHTVTLVDNAPVLGDAVSYAALNSLQPGCDAACFVANEGGRYELRLNSDKVTVTHIVASLPVAMPFIGYNLGWLGWYILVSIPLVILIRKLLKIYV